MGRSVVVVVVAAVVLVAAAAVVAEDGEPASLLFLSAPGLILAPLLWLSLTPRRKPLRHHDCVECIARRMS